MGLRALSDHVIVKRIANPTDMIVNGIVRPDITKEQPQEGIVITVGSGTVIDGRRVALDVASGDRVLFGKFSGQDVKVGLEEYLILREEDLFAVFTPDVPTTQPGEVITTPGVAEQVA
jgi:chaperonin GroES